MILAIYGAGDYGKQLVDYIESTVELRAQWERIIFVDDKEMDIYFSHSVYTFENVTKFFEPNNIEFCVAVGEPSVREILYKKIKDGKFSMATIIAPDAYVSPTAKLGEGLILSKGAMIMPDAVIGVNVNLQPYCIIGHDVNVGDHCEISPFVVTGGHSVIGARTYIGLTASVRDAISIGSDVIVSMGAVVQRDVRDSVIVMGNPARAIKNNDSKRVFGARVQN